MKTNNEPSIKALCHPSFTKLLLLILVAAFSVLFLDVYSLTHPLVSSLELQLLGNLKLTQGTKTQFRCLVFDGKNGAKKANTKVSISLINERGEKLNECNGLTSNIGLAIVKLSIPANVPSGNYRLVAKAQKDDAVTCFERIVTIDSSLNILVTTDKPLYQPSQKIHIRVLALASPSLQPVKKESCTITVEDPKGTLLWKKKSTTSNFGISNSDFQLADRVGLGTYTIKVKVGNHYATKQVTVRRYRLPRFRVNLSTDKNYYRPGEEITGTVDAQYIHGRAVNRAVVKLTLSTFIDGFRPHETISGKLRPDGRWTFKLQLPRTMAATCFKKRATVQLVAIVTDRAKHQQKTTRLISVTDNPLQVRALPESGRLIPQVENRIHILATYADGTPAKINGKIVNLNKEFYTNATGLTEFTYRPMSKGNYLQVEAKCSRGFSFKKRIKMPRASKLESLLLRTDRYLYETNDKVNLSLLTCGNKTVFLDVVSRNLTVSTHVVQTHKGIGRLSLSLPPHVNGTVELKAYEVQADNSMCGDVRVIYVSAPADLKIKARTNRELYAPGEEAKVSIQVTDTSGNPVQAALACSAVDEAVFALAEQEPSLASLYFRLQRELLAPKISQSLNQKAPIHRVINARISDNESAIAQARRLIFSLARGSGLPQEVSGKTYSERLREVRSKNKRALYEIRSKLVTYIWYIYLLFTVPFLIYTTCRFLYIPNVHFKKNEMSRLQEALAFLCLSWITGFILPALIVSTVKTLPLWLIVIGVSSAVVLCFCGQRKSVALFKSIRAAADLECMSTFISGLPLAYIAAMTIVALCTANLGPLPYFHRYDVTDHLVLLHLVALFVVFAIRTCSSTLAGSRIDAFVFFAFLGFVLLVISVPFFQDNLCCSTQHAGIAKRDYQPYLSANENSFSGSAIRIRNHFPETLLWKPQLITDKNGKLSLNVPLADSITTWRMALTANTQCGKIGGTTLPIKVFKAFYIEPDIPKVVTQNDRVSLPISLYNHSDKLLKIKVQLKMAKWFKLAGENEKEITLAAQDATRLLFPIQILKVGQHKVTVTARSDELTDGVERTVLVKPDGRKMTDLFSGWLSKKQSHNVLIPQSAVTGANQLMVTLYPSAFSQVVTGLEKTIRKPTGCFEQTSSTTYPNVLILSYLLSQKMNELKCEKRARHYIDMGYQRLLTFEVKGGGFSWFGNAPANERLTAYGLMEFTDMAKVRPISPKLINRTRKWLMSRQQQDGTFGSNRQTAYIAWALAVSGERSYKFSKTLTYLSREVFQNDDVYFLAQAANALLAAKHSSAHKAVQRLSKLVINDEKGSYWRPKGYGIFYTGSHYLAVETTALVVSALILGEGDFRLIDGALTWLVNQKDKHGTWGTTQSTIQALRALLYSTKIEKKLDEDCTVNVKRNGKSIGTVTIQKDECAVHHQLDLSQHLAPGRQRFTIETSKENKSISYQLKATHYQKRKRKSTVKTNKELSLKVDYGRNKISEYDLVHCTVKAKSHRHRPIDMPLVDIGIPPAFEPLWNDLEELVKKGTVARYEIRANRLFFYLEKLKPKKELSFSYRLRARYPVSVKTPPSWIYPYYEPDVTSEGNITTLQVH